MQVVKSKGVINGFRATELSRLVPEVVELGEQWEPPGMREEAHQHRYWELGYVAEGTCQLRLNGGKNYHLRAGRNDSLVLARV